MIADTTFLIDLARKERTAIARMRSIESTGETLWIPAPAIFEFWAGVEASDAPHEEARKIEPLLRDYTVRELGGSAAATAGRIVGELARRGTMVSPMDALIASIAIETGEPVITRNVRDFEKIPGVEVVPY